MRRLIALITLLSPMPAAAVDCSKIPQPDSLTMDQFAGMYLQRERFACTDFHKVKIDTLGDFCAVAIAEQKYTIFAHCNGRFPNSIVAMQAHEFRNGQPLPDGQYIFSGPIEVSMANGLKGEVPLIERK